MGTTRAITSLLWDLALMLFCHFCPPLQCNRAHVNKRRVLSAPAVTIQGW